MKIEHVQAVKNIPQKQQPMHLKQGEIFVSEVLEVNGKTALLRSEQGTLLTARLLGDISLLTGDHVETVVDESGSGRYVLRVVDVSRHISKGATGDAVQAQDSAAAQSIKVQILHSTLAMLKKNAGLDPKTAEFLARNGIAGTPENIDTLGRLAKGEQKTAALLMQIRGEAVSIKPAPQAAPAQPATAMGNAAEHSPAATLVETAVPTAQSEAAATTANPKTAAPPTMPTASATQSEPAMPGSATDALSAKGYPQATTTPQAGSTADQAVRPQQAPVSQTPPPVGSEADKPAHSTAVKTVSPNQAQSAAPQSGAEFAGKTVEARQPKEPMQSVPLAQQLLSMFVNIKDKQNLAGQLKKAVEGLPEQIKELKLLLKTVDINDRDAVAQKAEHLERQVTLLSEVKQFDCYHIPLTGGNREQDTAELYVYRQRRRKDEAQAENFVILLGLDTQHMGRVETVIRAGASSVSLEFRLEQSELGGAFVQGAKQMEPMIAQMGYRLTEVSAHELTAKTTVLTAEEVLLKGQKAAPGSLDVRI
jgi:hypothetical protein